MQMKITDLQVMFCREALGVQMPAINLFRDRTIVNVAERIRQTRRRGKKSFKHARSHNSDH